MEKAVFDELTEIWGNLKSIANTLSPLIDKIQSLEKIVKHNESRLKLIDERLGRYTTFLGGLDPFEKAKCRED